MHRDVTSGFLAVGLAVLGGCAAGGAAVEPPHLADARRICPQETGTRIPVQKGQCVGPGRVYSSEDIDRTGATNAADALRLLDPAITTR